MPEEKKEAPPLRNPTLLEKWQMNPMESQTYVQEMINNGPPQDLPALEVQILEMLKGSIQDKATITQRLREIEELRTQLRQQLQSIGGNMVSFATVLVKAEELRRKDKAEYKEASAETTKGKA